MYFLCFHMSQILQFLLQLLREISWGTEFEFVGCYGSGNGVMKALSVSICPIEMKVWSTEINCVHFPLDGPTILGLQSWISANFDYKIQILVDPLSSANIAILSQWSFHIDWIGFWPYVGTLILFEIFLRTLVTLLTRKSTVISSSVIIQLGKH